MNLPEPVTPCADLPTVWRSTAQIFREHEETPLALAYERCAAGLEEALSEESERPLTIKQAAHQSGYSVDHLSRLVREGTIPNAGRPGAPRIVQRDLPRKSGLAGEQQAGHLDPTQIVRSAIKKGA